MHDLDVTGQLASVAHTVKTTSDVHQAGLVCTAENVGAAVDDGLRFFSNDLLRNVRLFDGERAAETAAIISPRFSIGFTAVAGGSAVAVFSGFFSAEVQIAPIM